MRRSSADPSSASGCPTPAASRAWEKSRPIAAPICATSLVGPSRSSRAISEACKLAGTARARTEQRRQCAALRPRPPLPARPWSFFNEKRNAIRALDNVLSDALRQRLIVGDAVYHGRDFALPEPVEDDCSYMRPTNPRSLKFWPVGNDQ